MMRFFAILFGFISTSITVVYCEPSGEPLCLSRFDYDYKVLSKLVELDNRLKQMSESLELEQTKVTALGREINILNHAHKDTTVKGLDNHKSVASNSNTYVRWGRTSCPGNGTQLVYAGYAGGSHYTHSGGAVDYICLPKDPQWSKYKDGVESRSGYVYGAEYQLEQRDLNSFFGRNIPDGDVPCAVCSTDRPSVLMIPGRKQCYSGWTMEYNGYLTSGHHGYNAASQYVCLDSDAESIPDTSRNDNGLLFYFVEARCGALPCPPYVEGRELTCVVCSK